MNVLANLCKASLPNLASDRYGWYLFENHHWRCVDESLVKRIIIETLSNIVDQKETSISRPAFQKLQRNLKTVSNSLRNFPIKLKALSISGSEVEGAGDKP